VRIAIISTINRNYEAPFEVLTASLLRAKDIATEIRWHLFTNEDTDAWAGWLARLNARHHAEGASFVVHRLPERPGLTLPLRGRARPIMYARLLAPGLLADSYRRVLYLDADAVVLRPIEPLWATALDTHVCACSQDLAVPTVASGMAIRGYVELGLGADTPYFNAGVMLIDTARWQAEAVGARAVAYLAEHAKEVNLFDQEALNVALAGRWQRVSYRWNLIASVAGRPFLVVPDEQRADYHASLSEPCIVHFAGTLKPWRNPYLRGRWFEQYREIMRGARPSHVFEPSLGRLVEAVYDAWLRDITYPVERAIWEARRGF
jgi:lipopolysaccharide biosynthesis glycosyltransferase